MRSTVAFHARGTTGGLGYFLSFFHLHYANYENFSARDVLRLEIARLIQFCFAVKRLVLVAAGNRHSCHLILI